MSQVCISSRVLDSLKPQSKPYFVRDSNLKGFAVKVNPSGSIKFVAEAKNQGKSRRKTIGEYPVISLSDARTEALVFLSRVKLGQAAVSSSQKTLQKVLDSYLSGNRLKPRTIQDYSEAIGFYLQDWLSSPVSSITKEMVEKRFCKIRDKGVFDGKPTYSQATKTMRILSALMNYAMADDLIDFNPVVVLKQKRIDRSVKERTHYLTAPQAAALLEKTGSDTHPVTLAVHLMLRTGLRKNEALRLRWESIRDIEGVGCLVIGDTKNNRPHYVPITEDIQSILGKADIGNHSSYVFESTQRPGNCFSSDIRIPLKKLYKLIGNIEFRCHDLRRTFATRATEVGIDFTMVKRLLNHKSNDITSKYIQWESRANLLLVKEALEAVQY